MMERTDVTLSGARGAMPAFGSFAPLRMTFLEPEE
jgi:hypothetical protein